MLSLNLLQVEHKSQSAAQTPRLFLAPLTREAGAPVGSRTRLLTHYNGVREIILLPCKIRTTVFIVLLLEIVPPGKCDLLKFPKSVKNFNLLRFWLCETGLLKQTPAGPWRAAGQALD